MSYAHQTKEEKRKVLISYLYSKAHESDWHGVSDAANDLRVLEAEQKGDLPLMLPKGFKATREYKDGQQWIVVEENK